MAVLGPRERVRFQKTGIAWEGLSGPGGLQVEPDGVSGEEGAKFLIWSHLEIPLDVPGIHLAPLLFLI